MKPNSNIQKELLCLCSYFLNTRNQNIEHQYKNEQAHVMSAMEDLT